MTHSTSPSDRLATPIAIVGLSAIFAKAANLPEYWDNIVKKIDSITDVPLSRWNIDDYYDADPTQPDKTYCKRGGFIPDISFDPLEFGLPPNILELTDVSQLLALVVAKQALEDSGYGAASEEVRRRTGVILGIGGGQKLITPLTSRLQYPVWEKVLRSLGLREETIQAAIERMKLAYIPWEENSFPGMLGNVISGRVANRLDLGGINCVVDAACASSLSALQMAVSELTSGRVDMMLTGGVDTDNSIFMYMSFSKTPAFSRKNEIKPFDAESDGMMIGEGLGMLVLKRLPDAERDGDRIYAVIKGLGASSDGRYKSIYAPNSAGQELALRRAYESAGIVPSTVGLIEAHGTGTVAGDLCEVTTLNQFFRENNPLRQHIALGSVKSQIGHTKAAAGAASMIKVALALHHKILPPTINIQEPHPQLDIENSPFYLNTETRPWIRGEHPRRAGVSAFGFGGTNFHVVLEEYEPEPRTPYRLHHRAQTIVLHAPTLEALRMNAQELQRQLQSTDAEREYSRTVASSSNLIPRSDARLGFVADSLSEARDLLALAVDQLHTKAGESSWQHPKGVFYRRQALDGKVVALFPGQGAQHVEMGRELMLNFPVLRQAFGRIDALFHADGKTPVSQIVYPVPTPGRDSQTTKTEALQRTDYAQPAIGAMSAGLYQLFTKAGFHADFVAGHSFGELTALWAAGVMDETTYFQLMKARGESMSPPAHPGFDAGTMLAVSGTYVQLQAELHNLPGVYLANWNAHNQVVLAGPTSAIEAAQSVLQSKGYSVTRLPVAAAFHTPMVGHAQQPFAEAIHAAAFKSPSLPVYANATAQPYPSDPVAIQEQLSQHLLQPVLFTQQIENMFAAGAAIFIEFGPRNILTNLVKNILADRSHLAVALNVGKQKESDRQLRESVVQLRVAGVQLREIDPYAAITKPAETKSRRALNIQLNGSNYVSDRTRTLYDAALQQPAPSVDETPAFNAATVDTSPQPAANDISAVHADILAQLIDQQNKAARLHGEFLRQHSEQTQALLNLLGEATPQPSSTAPAIRQEPILSSNMQEPSPSVSLPTAVSGTVKPAAPEPFIQVPAPVVKLASSIDLAALTRTLIEVVSEKTGYPVETLEPSMDMESDLGINSIKRVEILGAMQTLYPDLPKLKPEELAELRTLGQIIEHIGKKLGAASTSSAPMIVPAIATPPVASIAPAAILTTGINLSALTQSLMEVVSEKTGYPVETLEPSMDMESDLGIDSIKRVEILGAMQTLYPDLPKLKPEELAELRTLGQIVEHIGTKLGANPTSSAPVVIPAIMTPPISAPAVNVAPVAVDAPSIDFARLTQSLMEVVSEKTGYPVETLEPSMDMESDLGIDSIKRVEILGAMQSLYPDLPKLKPEELAELRTLGQIVEHIGAKLGAHATNSTPVILPPVMPASVPVSLSVSMPVSVAVSGIDLGVLTTTLIEVVSEKTGYPVETLEPAMDMESDLGIDSIKRVEILGAMQSLYPDLPKLKPEELAELRTLGQIVEHIGAKLGGTSTITPPEIVAEVTAAPVPEPVLIDTPVVASSGVDFTELTQTLMEVVSEKTGYPVETLEPDMDMESDLGIDSIKRVEILGAMQALYPGLPKLKPEELAELRTLAQIVDHIGVKLGATPVPIPEEATIVNPPVPEAPRVGRSAVRLKALPLPDLLEAHLPAGFIALLTNDGTPATARLASALTERNWRVVVMNFPQTAVNAFNKLPVHIPQVTLPDLFEANLALVLKNIETEYGQVGAFIHLNPYSEPAPDMPFVEAEKAIVKEVFLLAKHLKDSLSAAASAGRSYFMTVARLDGEFGLGSGSFGAISGGLFGLTKTLSHEWPSVYCRALDLVPHIDPDKVAQYILAELQDPNRLITEVAYGLRGRMTLVGDSE